MNPFAPVIASCWITFYVVWMIAALFTKPTTERTAWQRGWWIWFAVAAVMFVVRRAILSSVSVVLWHATPLLGIAADAITVIGLLITLLARRALGANWSASVVFKEHHELIEGGPYRFVRHPIYSGVLLMLFGTMLVWGTLAGVVGFIVVIVGLSVKASLEERLLMKHFPQAYAGYRQRVRAAVIPFAVLKAAMDILHRNRTARGIRSRCDLEPAARRVGGGFVGSRDCSRFRREPVPAFRGVHLARDLRHGDADPNRAVHSRGARRTRLSSAVARSDAECDCGEPSARTPPNTCSATSSASFVRSIRPFMAGTFRGFNQPKPCSDDAKSGTVQSFGRVSAVWNRI